MCSIVQINLGILLYIIYVIVRKIRADHTMEQSLARCCYKHYSILSIGSTLYYAHTHTSYIDYMVVHGLVHKWVHMRSDES